MSSRGNESCQKSLVGQRVPNQANLSFGRVDLLLYHIEPILKLYLLFVASILTSTVSSLDIFVCLLILKKVQLDLIQYTHATCHPSRNLFLAIDDIQYMLDVFLKQHGYLSLLVYYKYLFTNMFSKLFQQLYEFLFIHFN